MFISPYWKIAWYGLVDDVLRNFGCVETIGNEKLIIIIGKINQCESLNCFFYTNLSFRC